MQQAVLGDLDQHVVDAGRGPAAALALVGAQQMGQARDIEPVTGIGGPDGPAGRQARDVAEHLLGVALEPVLVRDHDSLIMPHASRRGNVC